mmetsp:Transcript_3521/g.7642  ORF Transcript_3521/g.7642 Transcript_3521/m.7642 type:complete len:242 (+) Transcript_3521:594-1319(+)
MRKKMEQWSSTRNTFLSLPSRKNEWYRHELVNVENTAVANIHTDISVHVSRSSLDSNASEIIANPAINPPTSPIPCVTPLRISESTWFPSVHTDSNARLSHAVSIKSTPRCSMLLLTRESVVRLGAWFELRRRAMSFAPPGPTRLEESSRCVSLALARAPWKMYATPASRRRLRDKSRRVSAQCGDASSSPSSIAAVAVRRSPERLSSEMNCAESELSSSTTGMSSSSWMGLDSLSVEEPV